MYENPTHVNFLFQTEEVLEETIIAIKVKKVPLNLNLGSVSYEMSLQKITRSMLML